ncbi:RNA polymerase sigma factor [Sphingomonas sp.]|uniref:RNA polymerase sigma factor n=1 Tax=Sphingomonas sp. TaxID=28214 RepID=UPI0025FE681F|nr:RNA polymerase sigma factor [Sphingomonas sp.]
MTTALQSRLEIHWWPLCRFIAGRVGDASAAADITQEAFARFAGLPEDRFPANPKAYLFAVASNLAVDHLRARGGTTALSIDEDGVDAVPDPAPRADTALISKEELQILQAAIDDLPPRTREVFVMCKYDQLSYAEIADRLGIARNTVMVHMTRALSHCRDARRRYRAESE